MEQKKPTSESDEAKIKALHEALKAGLMSGQPRPFDSQAFLKRMHTKVNQDLSLSSD